MTRERRNLHLIAYDVTCNRRRRRLHGALESRGYALQFSVFFARLQRGERDALVSEIGDIINAEEDSVLIASLEPGAWQAPSYLGQARPPESLEALIL